MSRSRSRRVGPAVVTVVGTIPGQYGFFGQTADQTVSGSGFFISDQGYIITNNHVVEGTNSVTVVLSNGIAGKGHGRGHRPIQRYRGPEGAGHGPRRG